MIAGVAHAFGVAGATATQRRKQGAPAGVWCDEAVILVTEGHAALVEAEQAAVRDSDAVRVAGEISGHRLGPGEGRLGVDEPVLFPEWREVRGKGLPATQ